MTRMTRAAAVTVVVLLAALSLGPAAQAQYTRAEYDAYNAAVNEKNPQQRVKLLDDFVAKFPQSALLPYAYRVYYGTYNELRNPAKVVEYTDKLLGSGANLDAGTKLEALYLRAVNFHYAFSDKAPNAAEQLAITRQRAQDGLNVLAQLPKPEGVDDQTFAQNKKTPAALFHYTLGFAALQMKDYPAAIEAFRAALEDNPSDSVTWFRLGVAYLQSDATKQVDGFWALARSVALKGPGEAQVRDYLRKRLLAYQQPGCENLVDAQMNELITLAGTSAQRPEGYTIPSAAEIEKTRQATEHFISALKAGGDRAKLVWLAYCGLEFPELFAKVFEVTPGNDSVVLKVYTGASQDELEAAAAPNSEIKVPSQPGVQRLQKDDWIRYSATLASYDPEPFLLHWDKGKVNPEDIPEEKAAPGKRPGKRPTGKRPPSAQ